MQTLFNNTFSMLKMTLSIFLILLISLSSSHAREVSGVTVEWAPHYGTALENGGALTVITKEAFKRTGHNANVDFITWTRALKEVEEGKADFVMGAYYNDERASTYIYSNNVYNVEVGLVALDTLGLESYQSLSDLSSYTIGVARGWANSEEFDSADYLNKEITKNPKLNIKKLFRERVDLTVGARDILTYEAKQEKLNTNRMIFLDPPLTSNGLYLMASKSISDGQKIIDDFNQGLAEMKADGSLDEILKQYLNR